MGRSLSFLLIRSFVSQIAQTAINGFWRNFMKGLGMVQWEDDLKSSVNFVISCHWQTKSELTRISRQVLDESRWNLTGQW